MGYRVNAIVGLMLRFGLKKSFGFQIYGCVFDYSLEKGLWLWFMFSIMVNVSL